MQRYNKNTKFKVYITPNKDGLKRSISKSDYDFLCVNKLISKEEQEYLREALNYWNHNKVFLRIHHFKSFGSPNPSENNHILFTPFLNYKLPHRCLSFEELIGLKRFNLTSNDIQFLFTLSILTEAKKNGYVTYKTLSNYREYLDNIDSSTLDSNYMLYKKNLSYKEIVYKYSNKIDRTLSRVKSQHRLNVIRQNIIYDSLNLYIPVRCLKSNKAIWDHVKSKIDSAEDLETLYSLNKNVKPVKLTNKKEVERYSVFNAIIEAAPDILKYWYEKPKFDLKYYFLRCQFDNINFYVFVFQPLQLYNIQRLTFAQSPDVLKGRVRSVTFLKTLKRELCKLSSLEEVIDYIIEYNRQIFKGKTSYVVKIFVDNMK